MAGNEALEMNEKILQIKEDILDDKRIDADALMAVLEIFSRYGM